MERGNRMPPIQSKENEVADLLKKMLILELSSSE
jgi:hypothetical protein